MIDILTTGLFLTITTPIFFILGIILWSVVGFVIHYVVSYIKSKIDYCQAMWELERGIKKKEKEDD